MNINPSEIITHIIGFVLVLLLLRKYAWNGILGFVEKRRQTIVDQFAEIEQGKADAEALKHRYDSELQQIEDTRRDKIAAAAHEAEALGNDMKDDARREALATREKAKQDVEHEIDKAAAALKERMVTAVFTATEKLLHQELDRTKHEKLITDFLANVKVK